MATVKNPLVGKLFHTWSDKDKKEGLKYQGQVVSQVHLDIFLVQFYEALGGSPTIQKLFTLSEMKDWTFYQDLQDMEFWWKIYLSKGVDEYKIDDNELPG